MVKTASFGASPAPRAGGAGPAWVLADHPPDQLQLDYLDGRVEVFATWDAPVALGEVTGIDLDERTVELPDGRLDFDWLVLAAGAMHTYFGNDRWAGSRTADGATTGSQSALFQLVRRPR